MGEKANITAKTPGSKGKLPVSKTQKRVFPKTKYSPANQILQLQRTMGNREVQRLLKSGTIQASLTIGKPNDKYELEADRVADQVMRMPEPKGSLVNSHSSMVQRQSACPECPEKEEIQTKSIADQITPLVQQQVGLEEEEEPVQAKQANNPASAVNSTIESGINSIRGGGQPLPESTRSYFEPRFGADFSQVRVHTGSKASEVVRSVNAQAFAKGKDVVFGSGQYSPGTSTGRRLLAHELTHVVQQQAASKSSSLQVFPVSRAMDELVQCTNGERKAHRFSAEEVSVLIRTSCDQAHYGHAVIEEAVRDALDKIFNTDCIAEDRRLRIQKNLKRNGLDFICRRSASIGDNCARAEGFNIPANQIALGSKSFPGDNHDEGCGPLASTVLHEIIHLTRGVFPETLPRSCEASCYPEVGGDPTLCQTPIAPPP